MAADGPLVCGVDSSTQATKVEIRDAATGRLVARGRASHPEVRPPAAETDPWAWWDAFGLAMAQAGNPEVAAISVAGQQHGCVVLDHADQPIRPAKLWNDTTTAPDAAWLLDQLPGGAAEWVASCGSVPLAAFTITKLSWLHRLEADTWARLARVCLPHDWLTLQLTGSFVTDRGDASGTGYWSPSVGAYRADLLGIVDGDRDWSTALPSVLGPIEPAGTWNGAVVGPGTGDNMAAALGLGLDTGDVAVSIGTSGTVFAVSDAPVTDASGVIAGFADATGRFLPLACTLNAARVTDAVAHLLGVDAEALSDLALAGAPEGSGGSAGPTLVPYFDGERTPNLPHATGWITGLRTDVTREQLARAAFEGVVCGLLDALDHIEETAGIGGGRLWLVGGGARSAAYRQILADLAGRDVSTTDLEETVATGACVQAAAVLAQRDPAAVRASWDIGAVTTTSPRPLDAGDVRERYREASRLAADAAAR